MKLFVFEYLCSGAMLGQPIPAELCEQGKAMLTAIATDLASLGHEVVVPHDPRVELSIPRANIVDISKFDIQFDELAMASDAVLLIAPECDDLLLTWTKRVEALGVRLLNCTSQAVALFGDKLQTYAHLRKHNIPTIPTFTLNDAGWPAIDTCLSEEGVILIKPRDGVGCEATRLVRDKARFPPSEKEIAQPYLPGQPASCSAIVCDGQWQLLPPGYQRLTVGDEIHYVGGKLPITDEAIADRAKALTERVLQSAEGFVGYVGVDLLLGQSEQEDVVVEVNPRWCMSYIGLRELCQDNLAQLLFYPSEQLRWHDTQITFDASGKILK